jgi:alanine-synthesizing transaminase
MFLSSRLPRDPRPNALSIVLERLRRDGVEIADLTESNPTRVGLDYPPGLLAPLADPAGLVYAPHPFGLAGARDAISGDFRRRGLDVPSDRLVLTASTSEAYSVLFKLLCDPGDRVLVPAPSYPLFEYLTALEAVEAVPYPLHFDGRWSIDIGAVRDAMTDRTRAVLLVNPNNPTGSFVSAAELSVLGEVCRPPGLVLIGDEVFSEYAFDASHVTSVLRVDNVLSFALGGLSKSAGLPQVKLGWIAVNGPAEDVRRALDGLEVICDAYLSVATPVQQAAGSLLDAGAGIRAQILARTRANLDALSRAAAEQPAVTVLTPEGGWYAVVRVPRLRTEEALVTMLLEDHHVLVHPGYFFDFAAEAFLVVSLLPRTDTFAAAVPAMLDAACSG